MHDALSRKQMRELRANDWRRRVLRRRALDFWLETPSLIILILLLALLSGGFIPRTTPWMTVVAAMIGIYLWTRMWPRPRPWPLSRFDPHEPGP